MRPFFLTTFGHGMVYGVLISFHYVCSSHKYMITREMSLNLAPSSSQLASPMSISFLLLVQPVSAYLIPS